MPQRIDARLVAGLMALFAFAGCSDRAPTSADGGVTAGAPASGTATAAPAEPARNVVITEDSFRCIRDMTPVRGFFVDNLLGDLEATVAVAESPAGKTYPPGTLIQVIPTTALVKHQPGHSPETNDWEFIDLAVNADGATILGRGFADLNMSSGARANCFNCHEPAKEAWDLICEQGHGCTPIPLTPVMLRGIQNTDPRCPAIELPQDQIDALTALGRAPPAAPPDP
jgi:hypothetical protein